MKKKYINILSVCLMAMSCMFSSCTDYLDKDPDSTVDMDDAFKNFYNFQGYVEEIYNCIPSKEECYWTTSFNWGDDEIMNTEADWHMCHQVDLGNFWAWQAEKTGQDGTYLDGDECDPSSQDKFKHRIWPHAWYCIRKCNLGLENFSKMVDATTEERQLIQGQLYFFRAWWHFELMQYLGGLPYVDKTLDGTEDLSRLSFQECADRAAEDFRMAADLLPIDWDDTNVGKETLGKNQLRINKIMALGYLGKCYLWAGSPLMKNGAQVGGAMTYDYDEEYCKKAADALGELLKLVEDGETQYGLAQFKYDDIYNHTKSSDATSCFTEIFYTTGQNWLMPGSIEAIFRGPSVDTNSSNWNASKTWGPKVNGIVEHDNIIHQPTANYVNFYGMANGLPLTDSQSSFSKTQPFKDRDARFYHDIIFDGFKYINGTITGEGDEAFRYSQLYTGGNVRSALNGSRTGYFTQKLCPHTCNKYDGTYNWNSNLQMYLPYMRLADVYLMYAEACAAVGGSQYSSTTYSSLKAVDAINRLRDRAGVGHVGGQNYNFVSETFEEALIDPTYVNDKNKFMDEVRRERAVELAFEGFRFCDLQRWLLLTEYPYNVKTSQEFTRVYDDEWYTTNDPKDAEVQGWKEEEILTRNFDTKHYWFPMKLEDTYITIEFNQNPGW
ncbi:RagB/SusD family nutrient uptake outer membrane protein [Bacteroides caecigallinarum]|uniref:RagB/SusD family nutrient uptake outer membrane protein n=1 Tax=Bacteroides caecigallinarum TaxID=1411144 RepID=UPI001F341567|nr:RagB/SusD family nutrient uptake outer membrane protein [Bacteroides caecigallinarum]MCF2582820.1 RagB/SusD family nutrient uptake outer membrane protein [Bacteroides caecigallinarum]